MFKNFLKTAWRNLLRSKGYSSINIGGLAAGMAVALAIGLWVYDELSYNKYFANYDRIAQVWQHANFNGEISSQTANPGQMGPELRSKYGSDFKYVVQASWPGDHLLTIGNKSITQFGICFDTEAPEMLSIKMIKGSRQGLKDPYSILLSASAARAIFGNEDPMNKTLKIDRQDVVKVTGVYEDFPDNTTFKEIKIILPWELWGANFSQTFVQIADNAQMDQVSKKIRNVKLDKVAPEEKRYAWQVFLHPMGKWNLYNEFKNGVNTGGTIRYVWLFTAIGIFVLVLACINFMNLSTARSEKRAREVGIRKAIGSVRWQIARQFFFESYMVVFFAFIICLLVVALMLPVFNDVAGKKMSMPWSNIIFWGLCVLFIVVTGLLAGSYPALYLSSFQPLKVLKGTFKAGKNAALPRRILVVVQFTVSVILIIGTIIVHQQIQHAKDRPIGYQRNGLVNISLTREVKEHFDAAVNDLLATGAVESAAATFSPLTGVWNTNGGFEWEGKDPNLGVDFPTNAVTFDFGKTARWKIKSGRDFSREFATDSSAFIINESAAKFIGFENPVGKTLKWDDKAFTIIGVVEDLMQESPFYPVRPSLYFIGSYDNMSNLIVRLNAQRGVAPSIKSVEEVMKKYSPDVPFSYKFVDEEFGSKFLAEERIGKLSSYFAVLAIFISCLGLFGMASFVAEQRTKEMGIRKVLGASLASLWKLLSIEFIVLVLLSCIIATPVAYYYLDSWLSNYDYRVNISWIVFVVATVIAVLITIITVSFQAIKAASMNPVKSLRTE
jgi:putative ABC transport system permease protein